MAYLSAHKASWTSIPVFSFWSWRSINTRPSGGALEPLRSRFSAISTWALTSARSWISLSAIPPVSSILSRIPSRPLSARWAYRSLNATMLEQMIKSKSNAAYRWSNPPFDYFQFSFISRQSAQQMGSLNFDISQSWVFIAPANTVCKILRTKRFPKISKSLLAVFVTQNNAQQQNYRFHLKIRMFFIKNSARLGTKWHLTRMM